jgi:NhaA family Na+:H+ antiporter
MVGGAVVYLLVNFDGGFTVAIFISVLAFDDPALREEAKLAILLASCVAGIIGLAVLHTRHRLLMRRPRPTAGTAAGRR